MSLNLSCCLLIICLAAAQSQPQSNINDKLLETIESYMDTTKDPCNDFFAYACGKWSESHKSGRYSESTGLIDHKMNKRLVDTLESYSYGDDIVTDKVWKYYKSCRYERRRRLIRYVEIVKPEKNLDWPLLTTKSWPSKDFDLLKTIARLRHYGLNNALIEHMVLLNGTDSTQYIIQLDAPTVTDSKTFESLVTAILDNLKVENSNAFNWTKRIKAFEDELQKLREAENEYSLTTTIADIQDEFPLWSWKKYFELIFESAMPENYTFQIRNVMYLKELYELLNQTDPELICNYLMVRFLIYLATDRASSSDKIDCMIDLRGKMDLAMNFIYAENFIKNEKEMYDKTVRQLIDVIRDELLKEIDENRMNLDRNESDFLKEKLNKMRVNMGNLPKNVDRRFIVDYYRNIYLQRRNYFKNHLNLLEVRFLNEHKPINSKERPNMDDYFFIADSDTAQSSTLFYLLRQNMIIVPYGFLQTPIYHHNMYDVLKYSLLGFNLAHELGHGFDTSGVIYDYKGNVNEIGENITEADNFFASVACMQRNETPNIDERIADFVGLRLSYNAFFKPNQTLENLNAKYNGKSVKEIFFLNLAQFFCGNMESEFIDHDSDNVRLQETLSNFEPFAETYHCNASAKMNPQEKCRLW